MSGVGTDSDAGRARPGRGPTTRPLLDVRGLRVEIPTESGVVAATDGVSLTVARGEVLGVVGETGSGKSVTCRALLGLRPTPQTTLSGEVAYPDLGVDDVLGLDRRGLRRLWGREVAMIPQNPMTSLNPVQRVGDQVAEAVAAAGEPGSASTRRARVVELLSQVGIPAPERRLGDYPHQFSGGMLQRTLIAIALARRPSLLVADEPTTALDVLIQDQILQLLLSLQRDLGMTLVLVSHDLSVVSQVCDRVAVMYAGQVVELAETSQLLEDPRHPYTRALLEALPAAVPRDEELRVIPGAPPSLVGLGPTCRFAPRCDVVQDECSRWSTELLGAGGPDGEPHVSRCRRARDMAPGGTAAHRPRPLRPDPAGDGPDHGARPGPGAADQP